MVKREKRACWGESVWMFVPLGYQEEMEHCSIGRQLAGLASTENGGRPSSDKKKMGKPCGGNEIPGRTWAGWVGGCAHSRADVCFVQGLAVWVGVWAPVDPTPADQARGASSQCILTPWKLYLAFDWPSCKVPVLPPLDSLYSDTHQMQATKIRADQRLLNAELGRA
jgi:hypothetical protein